MEGVMDDDDDTTWQATVRREARRVTTAVLDRTPVVLRRRLLPLERFARDFQISARAVAAVRAHLGPGGRLLVFGVGRDSSTWELVNRSGRTVFLEDVPGWIDRSVEDSPDREVHQVRYLTRVDRSLRYEDPADIPVPELPEALAGTRWDAVVVDGPYGWGPETPGRAGSIALARRLVESGGIVVVDDYERAVERHSCDIVFGRQADVMLDPRRPVVLFRC
jgi:hypothetical protein